MIPTDITTIASAAVPYIVMGAEALSKKAGEIIAGNIGELYRTVQRKFKEDNAAEKMLIRTEEHPESEEYQAKLGEILAEKMTSDEDFANLMCNLVNAIKADENTRKGYNVSIENNKDCNIIGGGIGNTIG